MAVTELLTVAWIELTDVGESCKSRLATNPATADRCSLSGFEPEVGKTGAVGLLYSSAEGRPGIGLFTEIAAGVLAVAAGAMRLLRPD